MRRTLAFILITLILAITTAEGSNDQPGIVDASKVLDEIKDGKNVSYDRVTIMGDLNLSKIDLPVNNTGHLRIRDSYMKDMHEVVSEKKRVVASPITITNSTIAGIVNFNNTIFTKSVDLENDEFEELAYFVGAIFKDNADLSRTQFAEYADFFGSSFSKDASFKGAQFNNYADFESSNFALLRMNEANFSNVADFKNVIFSEDASFCETQFNGDTKFDNSSLNKIANFMKAVFKGEASFHDARFIGDAKFEESQFRNDVSFFNSSFHDITSFDNADFFAGVNLLKSNFNKNASFFGANFHEDANFELANFNEDADFTESQFKGDAFFVGATFNKVLNLTRTRYGRLYIRYASIKKICDDETANRLLEENFKKLGLFDDANKLHYESRKERLMQFYLIRHYPTINEFGSHLLDFGAWTLYGYGVRPEFPLMWSVIIIMSSGVFFYTTNGVRKSTKKTESKRASCILCKSMSHADRKISFWEAINYSATAFTSGANSIFSSQSDFESIGKSRYVVTLERILGWIFFALFLTALGNSVIR